jgi:hypothetical protein
MNKELRNSPEVTRKTNTGVPDRQQIRSHPILDLQRSIGNRAVGRLIQAKLQASQPGDVYEQEADQIAKHVVTMSAQQGEPGVQLQANEERNKKLAPPRTVSESVAKQEVNAGSNVDVDDEIERKIGQSIRSGSSLPEHVRSFMEPRFGTDFSGVRVHTGPLASQLNEELNAQAFTVGSDIYYGAGKSPSDSELTAHELTHVVQQGSAASLQKAQLPPEGDDVLQGKFAQSDGQAHRTFHVGEAEHTDTASADPTQRKKVRGGNLPDQLLTKMEGSFGADFSDVTIHERSSMAKDLNATAFTQGNEIHFAPGEFSPESTSGQEILSHELSHVIQGRQGRVKATHQEQGYEISDQRELEAEADTHAKIAPSGARISGHTPLNGQAQPGSIQRKSAPLQLYRSLPTGATVLGIRPELDNIYLACSHLANRVERRVAGNVNWIRRIGGDLEGSFAANSMPIPLNKSFTEDEGINFDWTVTINWRTGEPREMGNPSTSQVTRTGGGGVQQTSGTTTSTTDSVEASGSAGGHEGAAGGGVKAGTSTTQGSSESRQVTVQGGVSRTGGETSRSYTAQLVALITVSGSANFSSSDYVNPFKWGTAIGSEITTNGPQSGSYHAGTIDYQDSRPT